MNAEPDPQDLDAAFVEAVADAGPHDDAEPPPAVDLPLHAPVDLHQPVPGDESLMAADDESVHATVDEQPAPADPHILAAVHEPVPAAVDESVHATVDEQPAAVDPPVLAAVDESLPAAIDESVPAAVDPPVLAAVDQSVHAAVDEHQFAAVNPPVPAAVDTRQSAAVDEREPAPVDSSAGNGWRVGQVAGISVAAVGVAAIVLTMLLPKTAARDASTVAPPAAPAVGTPAAVANAPVPAAAAARPPAPAWRATDEWTGGRKKSVAYEVAADRPVRLWMRQATPLLVVRCLGGTLDAFVVTGSASAIEPGRNDHTVQLSLDDAQGDTQHWTDSADHDGLFAPNGPAVFSRLASARTLRFTFTPHNAPVAEAVFNVRGADALAASLGKHCR